MTHASLPCSTLTEIQAIGTKPLRRVCATVRNAGITPLDKHGKVKGFGPCPTQSHLTGEDVQNFNLEAASDYIAKALVAGTLTYAKLGELMHWAVNVPATPSQGQRSRWSKSAGRKAAASALNAPNPTPASIHAALGHLKAPATAAAAIAATMPPAPPKPKAQSMIAGATQTFEVSVSNAAPAAASTAPAFLAPAASGPFRWAMKLEDGTTLDPSSPVGMALASYCTPLDPSEPAPKAKHVNHVHEIGMLTLIAGVIANRAILGGLQPVCIIGAPGGGKSTGLEALMHCMGRNPMRASMGSGLRSEDLIGTRIGTGNGVTPFIPGIITETQEGGGVLVIDEIGSGKDGVWASCFEAFEADGSLTIKEDGGRRIQAHPDRWFLATDNHLGTDSTGRNSHSTAGSEALKSRFLCYQMGALTAEREQRVLEAWGVDKSFHGIICNVSAAMRKLASLNSVSQGWGLRESVSFGLFLTQGILNADKAWRAVYADKLPEPERVLAHQAFFPIVPESMR